MPEPIDDGDEEAGAERLGDELADQLHALRALRHGGVSVVVARRSTSVITPPSRTSELIRSRSSTTVASNAAGVPIGTGSGTDQCSHPGSATPFLMGPVAHRHHQRRPLLELVEVTGRAALRSSPARRAAATASGWTRSAGWVPAEVAGGTGELAPQGGGHLGARRVLRAHEQRRLRLEPRPGCQVVEGLAVQVHVAAAPVPRGAGAADEPDPLQHVEVVGQQVRGQLDQGLELARHPVRGEQLVDDGETDGVAERGMPLGSGGSRGVHHPTIPLATS